MLFGIKRRFAIAPYDAIPGEEVLTKSRPLELAMTLINLVARLVPRAIGKEARYKIGDMVVFRCGKQPEGSEFEARIWLDHFKVISVEHPSYGLGNDAGRKSRKTVHFRG